TIPSSGFPVLEKELREGRGPITLDSYRQYILATLRRMSSEDISRIHGVTEGLENPLYFGALMVYHDDADGLVAGSINL
ncbi:unnamed protein product, partial [marine sediment metagenome]